MSSPPDSPATAVDVAVIGAGPAGLAAACAVADGGRTVAVLDLGERIGGQYYRHSAERQQAEHGGPFHHGWGKFVALRRRFEAHLRRGTISHHPRCAVWSIDTDASSFTVRAVEGERERLPRTLDARSVIVATGAHDRHIPFPGWTLPGVMAGGGAQALLKGSGVAAGTRAVVAGTGPFLFPVADGLLAAGVSVAEILEANAPWEMARSASALPGLTSKLGEAAGYAATLARARVPYRTRHAVVAAHGRARLEAVTVAQLDADWHPISGSERRIDCDLLTVGYGFTPQIELLLAAGCEPTVGDDGSLVVVTDRYGRTNIPRIYAAGETTGIGGSDLALIEGRLCGRAAAEDLGSRVTGSRASTRALELRRVVLRQFARAMHRAHPVRDGWIGWLEDDTLVCRCEEVAHASVRAALRDLGAGDARTVKLLARPGMGWCQGRICGPGVTGLTAHYRARTTTTEDLAAMGKRTIATPVPLGQLAKIDDISVM